MTDPAGSPFSGFSRVFDSDNGRTIADIGSRNYEESLNYPLPSNSPMKVGVKMNDYEETGNDRETMTESDQALVRQRAAKLYVARCVCLICHDQRSMPTCSRCGYLKRGHLCLRPFDDSPPLSVAVLMQGYSNLGVLDGERDLAEQVVLLVQLFSSPVGRGDGPISFKHLFNRLNQHYRTEVQDPKTNSPPPCTTPSSNQGPLPCSMSDNGSEREKQLTVEELLQTLSSLLAAGRIAEVPSLSAMTVPAPGEDSNYERLFVIGSAPAHVASTAPLETAGYHPGSAGTGATTKGQPANGGSAHLPAPLGIGDLAGSREALDGQSMKNRTNGAISGVFTFQEAHEVVFQVVYDLQLATGRNVSFDQVCAFLTEKHRAGRVGVQMLSAADVRTTCEQLTLQGLIATQLREWSTMDTEQLQDRMADGRHVSLVSRCISYSIITTPTAHVSAFPIPVSSRESRCNLPLDCPVRCLGPAYNLLHLFASPLQASHSLNIPLIHIFRSLREMLTSFCAVSFRWDQATLANSLTIPSSSASSNGGNRIGTSDATADTAVISTVEICRRYLNPARRNAWRSIVQRGQSPRTAIPHSAASASRTVAQSFNQSEMASGAASAGALHRQAALQRRKRAKQAAKALERFVEDVHFRVFKGVNMCRVKLRMHLGSELLAEVNSHLIEQHDISSVGRSTHTDPVMRYCNVQDILSCMGFTRESRTMLGVRLSDDDKSENESLIVFNDPFSGLSDEAPDVSWCGFRWRLRKIRDILQEGSECEIVIPTSTHPQVAPSAAESAVTVVEDGKESAEALSNTSGNDVGLLNLLAEDSRLTTVPHGLPGDSSSGGQVRMYNGGVCFSSLARMLTSYNFSVFGESWDSRSTSGGGANTTAGSAGVSRKKKISALEAVRSYVHLRLKLMQSPVEDQKKPCVSFSEYVETLLNRTSSAKATGQARRKRKVDGVGEVTEKPASRRVKPELQAKKDILRVLTAHRQEHRKNKLGQDPSLCIMEGLTRSEIFTAVIRVQGSTNSNSTALTVVEPSPSTSASVYAISKPAHTTSTPTVSMAPPLDVPPPERGVAAAQAKMSDISEGPLEYANAEVILTKVLVTLVSRGQVLERPRAMVGAGTGRGEEGERANPPLPTHSLLLQLATEGKVKEGERKHGGGNDDEAEAEQRGVSSCNQRSVMVYTLNPFFRENSETVPVLCWQAMALDGPVSPLRLFANVKETATAIGVPSSRVLRMCQGQVAMLSNSRGRARQLRFNWLDEEGQSDMVRLVGDRELAGPLLVDSRTDGDPDGGGVAAVLRSLRVGAGLSGDQLKEQYMSTPTAQLRQYEEALTATAMSSLGVRRHGHPRERSIKRRAAANASPDDVSRSSSDTRGKRGGLLAVTGGSGVGRSHLVLRLAREGLLLLRKMTRQAVLSRETDVTTCSCRQTTIRGNELAEHLSTQLRSWDGSGVQAERELSNDMLRLVDKAITKSMTVGWLIAKRVEVDGDEEQGPYDGGGREGCGDAEMKRDAGREAETGGPEGTETGIVCTDGADPMSLHWDTDSTVKPGRAAWGRIFRQHFFSHQLKVPTSMRPLGRSAASTLLQKFDLFHLEFALNPFYFDYDAAGKLTPTAVACQHDPADEDSSRGYGEYVDSEREPPVEAFGSSGLVFGRFSSIEEASAFFQLDEHLLRDSCLNLIRERGGVSFSWDISAWTVEGSVVSEPLTPSPDITQLGLPTPVAAEVDEVGGELPAEVHTKHVKQLLARSVLKCIQAISASSEGSTETGCVATVDRIYQCLCRRYQGRGVLPIHVEEALWEANKKHFISVVPARPQRLRLADASREEEEAYVLNPQYKFDPLPSTLRPKSGGNPPVLESEPIVCFAPSGVCLRMFNSISRAAQELQLTPHFVLTQVMQAPRYREQLRIEQERSSKDLADDKGSSPRLKGSSGPVLLFDWLDNASPAERLSADQFGMSATDIRLNYLSRPHRSSAGGGDTPSRSGKRALSGERKHKHAHTSKRRRGEGLRETVRPAHRYIRGDFLYLSGTQPLQSGSGEEIDIEPSGEGPIPKKRREMATDSNSVDRATDGDDRPLKKDRVLQGRGSGPATSAVVGPAAAPVVPVDASEVVVAAPSYIRSSAQQHWEEGLTAYCERHEIDETALDLSIPSLRDPTVGFGGNDSYVGVGAAYAPEVCTCRTSSDNDDCNFACLNELHFLRRIKLAAFPPGTLLRARLDGPTSTGCAGQLSGRAKRNHRSHMALVCSIGRIEVNSTGGDETDGALLVVFDGKGVRRVPLDDVVLDNEDDYLQAWYSTENLENAGAENINGSLCEEGIWRYGDVYICHMPAREGPLTEVQELLWQTMNCSMSGGSGGDCVNQTAVSPGRTAVERLQHHDHGNSVLSELLLPVPEVNGRDVTSDQACPIVEQSIDADGSGQVLRKDCRSRLVKMLGVVHNIVHTAQLARQEDWSLTEVEMCMELLDRFDGDLHAVRRRLQMVCTLPVMKLGTGGVAPLSRRLVRLMHVLTEGGQGQSGDCKIAVFECAARLRAASHLLSYGPPSMVLDDVCEWAGRRS